MKRKTCPRFLSWLYFQFMLPKCSLLDNNIVYRTWRFCQSEYKGLRDSDFSSSHKIELNFCVTKANYTKIKCISKTNLSASIWYQVLWIDLIPKWFSPACTILLETHCIWAPIMYHVLPMWARYGHDNMGTRWAKSSGAHLVYIWAHMYHILPMWGRYGHDHHEYSWEYSWATRHGKNWGNNR